VKEYEKAQAEYKQSLQLFPRYADAVFDLGILYLDADKMPNLDLVAKFNAAIAYLQAVQADGGRRGPDGWPGG